MLTWQKINELNYTADVAKEHSDSFIENNKELKSKIQYYLNTFIDEIKKEASNGNRSASIKIGGIKTNDNITKHAITGAVENLRKLNYNVSSTSHSTIAGLLYNVNVLNYTINVCW